MKHFIASIVFFIFAAASDLSAQDVDIFGDDITKYLPKQTAIARDPASPCNQGEEPFSVFIKKFNTDPVFRAERTKADWCSPMYDIENPQQAQEYLESSAKYLKDYGALPVAPMALKRRNGESTFKTFFTIGENRVGYYVSSEGEGGGSSARIGFKRKKDKWYLVYIQLAG